MNTKTMTRAEIGELLRPRPEQTADELAALTLEGLGAALRNIEAGEMPSDTLHYAAAAIGYLLAGSVAQAARSARQVVVPQALTAVSPPATPTELLAGVGRVRALLQTPQSASRVGLGQSNSRCAVSADQPCAGAALGRGGGTTGDACACRSSLPKVLKNVGASLSDASSQRS
jgi:hypothetical protein